MATTSSCVSSVSKRECEACLTIAQSARARAALDRYVNMIHFVNVVHEFVPHARRREDKTHAVLDAAMRLVVADGLEALTLQRVAAELGLVTTAIYRYFASK